MDKKAERYLVIGADGLIGSGLSSELKSRAGTVIETTCFNEKLKDGWMFLDLSLDVSDWRMPEGIQTVYFLGAETSLENCRKDPEYSRKVNVVNTIKLAKRLIDAGCFVVFPSTNLVYNGSIPFQKAEYPVCPVTEYGRQKAETEKQLLSLGNLVSIVRFTKVLPPGMPLFKGWAKALKNKEAIHPFSDMVFSPVPLSFAVRVLLEAGKKRLSGIIQVSGGKDISYEQAALHLAERMGASQALIKPILASGSGAVLEAIPAHTTLDTTRLRSILGMKPPDVWKTIDTAFGLS